MRRLRHLTPGQPVWKNNYLILRSRGVTRFRSKTESIESHSDLLRQPFKNWLLSASVCEDEMWLSKHYGFQWEYSWSLVAKMHRNGGCLCGIVHLGDEWKKWAEIDENGQSVELLAQWSSPLTSQSLCGVELFSIRLSMEGQWKDLGKQSAQSLGVKRRVLWLQNLLFRITSRQVLMYSCINDDFIHQTLAVHDCLLESIITVLYKCYNHLETAAI